MKRRFHGMKKFLIGNDYCWMSGLLYIITSDISLVCPSHSAEGAELLALDLRARQFFRLRVDCDL